jgi:hypothetical protein
VVTESGVEVLERLPEAHLCRVQFAHGRGQPVLGEIHRLDLAYLRDQSHRAQGRLLVPVGKHVEVGMAHALAVQRARLLGEAAIAQPAFVHERAERVSEGLIAQAVHRCLAIVPSSANSSPLIGGCSEREPGSTPTLIRTAAFGR